MSPLRCTVAVARFRGVAPAAAAVAPASPTLAPPKTLPPSRAWMEPVSLVPREVVEALSQHIIGQDAAKRAIAIALRNRWRRMRLSEELQSECIPKNMLLIGPTGVCFGMQKTAV